MQDIFTDIVCWPKEKYSVEAFFFSSPLFDLTLLPVYIITAIKVKLRVELYLFLLQAKIQLLEIFE